MGECGGDGVVRTEFTIQPSGVVREIKLDGDHTEDKVGQCVRRRLQRVRFPTAQAPTPVTHPFHLN